MTQDQKHYKNRKKERGLCIDCSEPATQGVYCKYHRDKYNEVTSQIRRARRDLGICIRCGDTLRVGSLIFCERHLFESKKRREKKDIALTGLYRFLFGKTRMKKEEFNNIQKTIIDIINEDSFQNIIKNSKRSELKLKILELRCIQQLSLRDVAEKIDRSHETVRRAEREIAQEIRKFLKN